MPKGKRTRRRRQKPQQEDALAMMDRHLLTRIKSSRNGKVIYITNFEAIVLQLQKLELEGDAPASRLLLKYEDLSKHVAEKQVELEFTEDAYTRSLKGESGDGDYPIGYRKPPKGRPFQPGESGNPNGRPRGKKDLGEIVQKTLNASMSYRENGKTKVAPRREVAFKLLVEKAKKGHVVAAELILEKRKHALRRGRKGALKFVVTEWLPDPPAQMSGQEAQDLPMQTEDPIQGSEDGGRGGQYQSNGVDDKPTQAEES